MVNPKKRYLAPMRMGGTRVVSLGRFIPPEWLLVEVTEIDRRNDDDNESVTITIRRVK